MRESKAEEGGNLFSVREVLVFALCLGLIVGGKVVIGDQVSRLQRSNGPEQPLVVVDPDYFNESSAEALRACAMSSAVEARNVLGELFVHSRSVAAGFNAEGASRLASSPLACLAEYFERARDPEANAWVLNVLVCEADSERDPVQWHIDQTIALRLPIVKLAAHAVDVWYAALPSMDGGELELARFSPEWLHRHAMRSFKPTTKRGKSLGQVDWTAAVRDADEPSVARHPLERAPESMRPLERALVTPRTNTHVTFRGDAHHRIRPFKTYDSTDPHNDPAVCERDRWRVSVVLEQYRVPRLHYWNTVPFYLAT